MKLTHEDKILLYRNMLRGRKYDEALTKMFNKGQVPGMWHSGIGHEAVGAGVATFLRQDDWLEVTHRGITHGLAKGLDARMWLAEHLGRVGGYAKGKGGHHCADREHGILIGGGTIGSCFPIAAGAGLAAKRLGKDQIVVCLFGDGAAQRATLHSCMNLAGVWNLPIVWVCENNLYSITTHVKNAIAAENIADLAHSYNMPGEIVDGQDVLMVTEVVMDAVERARNGKGPSLIECKTYRFREHGEGEIPTPYRTREEVKEWKKRDPIKLFRYLLLDEGVVTEEDLNAIGTKLDKEVAETVDWAIESPMPALEEAFTDIYVE
ncbi:MAG: thiamine pyrophosphate-dependent dehydrogenase E1 component subunit alpha [Anaerolineales bacterium]|nr:thiamine pyrophosphate-dependent dehydrogenase E1 component subunit alpha [Anaerolineales bacterium]